MPRQAQSNFALFCSYSVFGQGLVIQSLIYYHMTRADGFSFSRDKIPRSVRGSPCGADNTVRRTFIN